MAEVIGVRFKNTGKVYYFDPQGEQVEKGSMAIVETARGMECGEIAMANREVADESIVQPLRKLVRLATPEDLKKVAENHIKEKKAFKACEKKIAERGLEMKLVDVEYTFDNSKILFYFTADGRVDFRELVKDLAGICLLYTSREGQGDGRADHNVLAQGFPAANGLNPLHQKARQVKGRVVDDRVPVSYTHLDVYKRQVNNGPDG